MRGIRGTLLSLLLLLLAACEAPPTRTITIELSATNTADRILVVEGTTDLPGGAPVRAELLDREGRVYLKGKSVVRRGRFYFSFNLEDLSALSLYRVAVVFDPQEAPLGVRKVTGLWGESLRGAGVVEVDGRRIIRRDIEVKLTAGTGDKDWEGRDFDAMEVTERVALTQDLQKYLELNPKDHEACLALARAYIASDPKEGAEGTRAHQLLKQVAEGDEESRAVQQARTLLAEFAAKAEQRQHLEQTRKADAAGDKYRRETLILPGRSLGGFVLNSPFQVVSRHFQFLERPNFSEPVDVPLTKVVPKDMPEVQLTYRTTDRRLVAIRTTSPRFVLPEGYGVGSLLQELQREFGREVVPTPKFRGPVEGPGGKKLYRGIVTAHGLEFEVLREVDPIFGMPVDHVEAISVFLP